MAAFIESPLPVPRASERFASPRSEITDMKNGHLGQKSERYYV